MPSVLPVKRVSGHHNMRNGNPCTHSYVLDKTANSPIISQEMIILVESDKDVRKSLADLISRERIIGVDSIQEALQMFLKFRNDLDLVVANVNLLSEMLSKQLIDRVCQKLSMAVPPVIAVYKPNEEDAKDAFLRAHKGHRVIKYSDKDLGFPSRYLEVIQKACPGLVIDYEKARESWLKKQKQPTDFIDPRTWLAEEGFIDTARSQKDQIAEKTPDDVVSSIQALLHETAEHDEQKDLDEGNDYRKMYLELREKHDALLKHIRTFMESIGKSHL